MEERTAEQIWLTLQENSGRFVEIVFEGGETIHAYLLCASQDMDGSRLVAYDLYWTSQPESRKGYVQGDAFCDEFEYISAVQPLSSSKAEGYAAQQLRLRK